MNWRGRNLEGSTSIARDQFIIIIVDFFCSEFCLAIEIDGRSHDEQVEFDNTRQQELEALGVHFLRFTDRDVKQNLSGVVEEIVGWIDTHQHTPSPSQEGNGDGGNDGWHYYWFVKAETQFDLMNLWKLDKFLELVS